MKSSMEEFEDKYKDALPCDNWAVVQLSARKYAVIVKMSSRGLMDNNRFRSPTEYIILSTHTRRWEAQDRIRSLILADVTQQIQEKGKAYLITLTDGQLGQLPMGALNVELMTYINARRGKEEHAGNSDNNKQG